MSSIYSEDQYKAIKKQLSSRRLIVWGLAAILFAAAVVVLVSSISDWHSYLHPQENSLLQHLITYPWAFILPILTGCIIIFGCNMVIGPVKYYKDFLDCAFYGKTRMMKLLFKEADQNKVTREGIWVISLLFSDGNLANEKDDRLLYLDANLPFPDWKSGDSIELTVHDKFIVDWQRSAVGSPEEK